MAMTARVSSLLGREGRRYRGLMVVERGVIVMRMERKGRKKERNRNREREGKGNDWMKRGELIQAVAEPESQSHQQLSVPATR